MKQLTKVIWLNSSVLYRSLNGNKGAIFQIQYQSNVSEFEHHLFLSVCCKLIYSEFWRVKDTRTNIKLFYILASLSVWVFMRQDYFSIYTHNYILNPPHVDIINYRCTNSHLASFYVLYNLRPFSYKDQKISLVFLLLLKWWENEKDFWTEIVMPLT